VVCIFAERSQKDGPKVGNVVFGNSWMDVFGDVLKTCGFDYFEYI
jgi:hypothetical protein